MWPLNSSTWRGCQLSCGGTSLCKARANVAMPASTVSGRKPRSFKQLQLRASGIKGKPILVVLGNGFLIGRFHGFRRTLQHFQIAESGFCPI